MARSESKHKNRTRRWKKIQEQFNELMKEATPSGAKPSAESVIGILAENWCISTRTVETILKKQL